MGANTSYPVDLAAFDAWASSHKTTSILTNFPKNVLLVVTLYPPRDCAALAMVLSGNSNLSARPLRALDGDRLYSNIMRLMFL